MTLINISTWQIYIGIAINAVFAGIGTAFGNWIFNHFKERVAKKGAEK